MDLYIRPTSAPTAIEQVLAALLDDVGRQMSEREIREIVGLPKPTCSAALRTLAREGLVETRSYGRTLMFAVSASDPLIRHAKIARTLARVRDLTDDLSKISDSVVLFGSASVGEDSVDSDIDLFVVSRDPEGVRKAAARFPRVQAVVVTPQQHMRELAEGSTLASEVARGIRLWERP